MVSSILDKLNELEMRIFNHFSETNTREISRVGVKTNFLFGDEYDNITTDYLLAGFEDVDKEEVNLAITHLEELGIVRVAFDEDKPKDEVYETDAYEEASDLAFLRNSAMAFNPMMTEFGTDFLVTEQSAPFVIAGTIELTALGLSLRQDFSEEK